MNIEKAKKEKRVSISAILLMSAGALIMLYLLNTLPLLGWISGAGRLSWLGIAARVLYILIACVFAALAVSLNEKASKVFKIILAVWFVIGFVGIFFYLNYAGALPFVGRLFK